MSFARKLLAVWLGLLPCLFVQAQSDEQVAAVMQPLDDYMAAVNRIDIPGIVAHYHFPHFRVVGSELVIWHTPKEAMPMLGLPKEQQLAAMRVGLGERWVRTDWGERQIIAFKGDKAHVDTEFIRYAEGDEVLERIRSLYVVTREHGSWKIKGRSSFAPR